MRVVNICPTPRYYAYGNVESGRMLASGQSSPELPLVAAFGAQLQADLAAGNIQIQLNEADQAFLGNLARAGRQPIRVKRLPRATPPPVKAAPEPRQAPTSAQPTNGPSKAAQAALDAKAKPRAPVAPPPSSPPAEPDLSDLVRENRLGVPVFAVSRRSSAEEISQSMKGRV